MGQTFIGSEINTGDTQSVALYLRECQKYSSPIAVNAASVRERRSTMTGYRLYFVDEKGAIQAREEFIAADDDAALIVSELVYRACSDACYSYELWQADRRVIAFDSPRSEILSALTDQKTVEIQQITLTLEEALQNSSWRIGRSQKLASEMELLRERSQALLMRQARTQDPRL